MKISDKGLNIIKEFEGYGRALPNGDCTAYQERLSSGKLDVPTIGWGCTDGVTMGLVWTRAQAEEGLKRELVKKETAVTSLLKFIPTQNQFDAMLSLTYNIGEGGFARSSVLRYANEGDFHKAADSFAAWNKAGGGIEPGLVRRRAMEAALFVEDSSGPKMVQSVDEPAEGWSPTTTSVMNNTQSTVAAGGGIAALTTYLGMAPEMVMNFVRSYGFEIAIVGCVLIFVITEAFKHFKGDKQ